MLMCKECHISISITSNWIIHNVYLNLRVSANVTEDNVTGMGKTALMSFTLATSNDTCSKYFGTVHISTRDIQEHLIVCSRGVQS